MTRRRLLLLGFGLTACRPSVDVPTPWSSRALLVLEPEGDPFELVSVDLAQAQGERRPHPVEQLAGLYSVSWVLDGEALLAHTRDGGAWLSLDDEAEEPWLLNRLPGEEVSVIVAPDGGHAAVLTTTSLDVPAISIEVFDLRSRERVSRLLGCTFTGSFHWVGQGPAFLASITECEDPGAVVSRSLVHVRPELPHETLAGHPDATPRVSSVSPDGRFVAIEVGDRWQLHQLSAEIDAVVVIDEALGAERTRETWSFDGSSMAHLDAATLVVRDPTDTTRWNVPLVAPSLPLWSPRDARFLTLVRCGDTQRQQLHLGDPQRAEVTSLGDCEALAFPLWTPDAESLMLGVPCDASDDVALEWLDLATGERRRVAECGVSTRALRWSPDDSTLALVHACDAERSRIRLLDARGIERAASLCVESWLGQWSPDSDMVSLVTEPSHEDRTHVQLLHVDGGMLDLGPGNAGDWQPGSLR